jgi:hypothetical protein
VSLAVVAALVRGVVSQAVAAPSGTTTATAILKGVSNTANAVTTLVNSGSGAALSLQAKSGNPALSLPAQTGTAPLAVNSETKVDHLNADKLDGLDSGALLGANDTAIDSLHADQATNADKLDDMDSTQFANSWHTHSGGDITSGTVDANRIEDGPGSGLDADKLDGMDSTEFAASSTGQAFFSEGNLRAKFGVITKETLPAGSYVIIGNANAREFGNNLDGELSVDCGIQIDGHEIAGTADSAGYWNNSSLSVTTAYSTDKTVEANLTCDSLFASDPNFFGRLTAIRVSSIQEELKSATKIRHDRGFTILDHAGRRNTNGDRS